jgi:hypothetical protein
MARKPTDVVQFKLTIREALRRKIEKAAEKKAISANAEAVERIEETFEQEEWVEARQKEWAESEAEFEEQRREHYEEQARERALLDAAIRDSRILDLMIESRRGSAHLLRTLARELGNNPEWATTTESKKAFADRLHRYIMNNDFKEPSE